MSGVPDVPAHLIESLKSLGLTKYEALVYIGLLKVAGATATELHEISGVPRASVYPVLDRLIQKSLVSVSHATPKRFDAIPPEEGIADLMRRIEADARAATTALGQIYRERMEGHRGDQELIWSIYGQKNIETRLGEFLRRPERSVEILASWYLLESTVLGLLAPLRGSVEIEIVTDDWQGDIPSDMAVHVHRIIPKKPLPKEHAGVFLVDESRVFVWLGSGDAPCALTSESPGFVQFFRRYLDNIREWASSAHQ